MARPLRIEYDGALYHVTTRGNARKAIYKDDEDRSSFLAVLDGINKRFNWVCHAYCLMGNHYHLVIETPDGNLSKGMRQLNGVYTQRYNRRHRRAGHVFQGRYKAIVIERESYLLEVSRYVVLNPVRARAVGKPDEWRWSSYRGTAGIDELHPCLTTDWILGQFGRKRRRAVESYREFVEAGLGEKGLWDKVRGQSILGADEFVNRLIGHVKGHEDVKEIPKRQRYIGRPSLSEIVKESGGMKEREQSARSAVIEYGYTLKEVADYFGIHYSTVSRALGRRRYARNKT